MHKIVIQYQDFEEQTQVEEAYFNLSRAKIIDMAITGEADILLGNLRDAVKSEDGKELIHLVRDLIHLSYGEKDPDGKTFRQSEQLSNDFLQSQPFDQMFYDMIMSPEQVLKFVEALFPQKLMEEARAKAAAQGINIENMALPRADGTPYFDSETTRASRPQPQDRLPKQVKTVELPEDGIEADRIVQAEKPQPISTYDGPLSDQATDADMQAFLEWKRQQNS